MSLTCTKEFSLHVDAASTCPIPADLNYTIANSILKSYAGNYDFNAAFDFTVIDNQQLIAKVAPDNSTSAIDMIDFSGVPTLVNSFKFNTVEIDWLVWALVYEPVNNLIVVNLNKGSDHKIAFFSPTTGYISSFDVPAYTVWSATAFLMPGSSGKVCVYRSRYQTNGMAVLTIVDVNTKTLEKEIELPSFFDPMYVGNGAFACPNKTFYLPCANGVRKVSYLTDAITNGPAWSAGLVYPNMAYVSSTDEIVCCSRYVIRTFKCSDDSQNLIIPDTQDLWDSDGTNPLNPGLWIADIVGVFYIHKLDLIAVSMTAYQEDDPNPYINQVLVLFLDPTDLSLFDWLVVTNDYGTLFESVKHDAVTGNIYLNRGVGYYTFNQSLLPVTITP